MAQSTSTPWLFRVGLFWLAVLSVLATALPSTDAGDLQSREESDDGNTLWLMPLGASITAGFKSPDNNGYRKALYHNLTEEGWTVHMVGSKHDGTMEDNANEGHVGYRVDQVSKAVDKVISKKPNLILINAGTNDATQGFHVSTAGERMDDLLTKLYKEIPGTTVILSTLLPNGLAQHNVTLINDQYKSIYHKRQEKKENIILADMSDLISTSHLVDGTHPDEFGYLKMAGAWTTAIKEASDKKMIGSKSKGSNDASSNKTRDVKSGSEQSGM